MYKVLLVDDEIPDLEGMKTFIPWDELGLDVVGAVHNGFAAWDILQLQRVDILITDVRMPNMSGLELARKALEQQEELRIIFVSGYQDFHYVKQALSMNACNYVLKPMDDRELVESLIKVRTELEQRRLRLEQEQAYRQMFPIAAGQWLLQWMQGTGNLDMLHRLERHNPFFHHIRWPVRVVWMETDDPKALGPAAVQWCEQKGISFCSTVPGQGLALLLERGMPLTLLQELIEWAGPPCTAGVSMEAENVHQLPEACRQAKAALEYKWLKGKGGWIEYADLADSKIHLLSSANGPKMGGRNWRLIQEMIQFVSSRLHENITLRDVANHFSFSPNYLGQLFKQETGKPFNECLILLRMEKARSYLIESRLKIYEIAAAVGYRYLPYFSRQFKETFGMTPMEYRRKFFKSS